MPRDRPPRPELDQRGSFPDARKAHDDILANPESYPEGWVEQARFREENDLPPFRPPRFTDGTRVRSAVRDLEDTYGITLAFVAYDISEGWMVEIDGTPAFAVDRYRDDAANTVVTIQSNRFHARVREAIEG